MLQTLEGHSREVTSGAFSPDGSKLTAQLDNGAVCVWNVVGSVVLSPDGSKLALAADDGTVRMWNVGTGQVEQKLKGHWRSVASWLFLSRLQSILFSRYFTTLGDSEWFKDLTSPLDYRPDDVAGRGTMVPKVNV